MTKIQIDEAVVRQALEALERLIRYGDRFLYRSHEQNPYDQVCDAATALRQALERPAPAQEPLPPQYRQNQSL